MENTKTPCPECKRPVYQLFQKGKRIVCAYCFKNLWAINKERESHAREKGKSYPHNEG